MLLIVLCSAYVLLYTLIPNLLRQAQYSQVANRREGGLYTFSSDSLVKEGLSIHISDFISHVFNFLEW